MASDALDKFSENNSTFSARHKIAIILCLSISCAILFAVYVFDLNSRGEEKSEHQHTMNEEEDDDYWLDEEDIVDDWDYWMFSIVINNEPVV